MSESLKKEPLAVREAAVGVLLNILYGGASASRALPKMLPCVAHSDRALLQELCFGVLRWQPRLEALQSMLMDKPLRSKDRDIRVLIWLGLYQLDHMSIPAHAVLQQTVQVAKLRNKSWARGLVNAVLRRFIRHSESIVEQLDGNSEVRYAHPRWILDLMQTDWPEHWPDIADAANRRPPMTLRINLNKVSRKDYMDRLTEAGMPSAAHPLAQSAVILNKPVKVELLPGFEQGWVSVQDAGAQLAADLLTPKAGERILDACAAPGGKTCHLLERCTDLDLLALDLDQERCRKITENLQRLSLQAVVKCADAVQAAHWWDEKLFDAILLDAPCSALGVLRRHPDIKILRKPEDIQSLADQQSRLLHALWPLLKTGGRLLYATCTISKQENSRQIARFIHSQRDAQSITINAGWGENESNGRQILTGEFGMDGFFYALIRKTH